jgi:O-antigen/teichoic acid export membrane protein
MNAPLEGQQREEGDIAALAKGGRTNVAGFLLRLAARIPFLFIAGRIYGADVLGRFAYAIIIVEFAAQIATMGLKRGLAGALAQTKRPEAHVLADAMVLTLLFSLMAAGILMLVPQVMFPNSGLNGLDRLLPLIIIAVACTAVALSACAWRFDIAATVRARALVEPWTISIAAWVLSYYSLRDGLILSYVLSMIAAMLVALHAAARHFRWESGWAPSPARLWRMARINLPLAAADAVEWGSRRLDLALLGLFVSPATVGIYYVAQQVASLPQKLKTSFEPILGPVITRNLAEHNYAAIARQVSQVGFWILAAQAGISLALGIPGEAVMGLVGPEFAVGALALGFLLLAEVAAAPAVVSESALVYMARHRNLVLSMGMIAIQIALTSLLLVIMTKGGYPQIALAVAPAFALAVALGFNSVVKSRLLERLLRLPIATWRPALVMASAVAVIVGSAFVALPHELEWLELALGVPTILAVYCAVIWRFGFGSEDRALFSRQAKAA